MTAAIEVGKLVQVVWVSLLAGVGLMALFSLLIYGSTRAAEHSRNGRRTGAALFAALAGVSALAVVGLVVFGIAIIVAK